MSMGQDPMQQMIQMRTTQAAPPVGPGQGMGAPQMGAPPASPDQVSTPSPQPVPTNGTAQDALSALANASVGRADEGKLAAHLKELQKLYPKLRLAAHNKGHAELIGPAQEQFLGAAYARLHQAKVAHVRNDGRGQRLHLEF